MPCLMLVYGEVFRATAFHYNSNNILFHLSVSMYASRILQDYIL